MAVRLGTGLTEMMTVAWISSFPIEWLPDLPPSLSQLPRMHPATWQRVLLTELETRADLRLHVVILRKHFERDATFERGGVTFHLIKVPPFTRATSIFWMDTFLIRKVLTKIKPDVVHAWGTENGAALVASRLQYPCLVTIQGLMTWIAKVVPLDRYHQWAAFWERASLTRASFVTAESSFAVQFLKERFPQLDLQQIEHAPHRCFQRAFRHSFTPPIRFLFVGTLSYGKGTDLLLRAFEFLMSEFDFVLTLVGDSDSRWLRKLKTSLSPEIWKRVIFKRHLTSEQICDEMAKSTMLIFPTRVDNSPNTVKEAVVTGLPVVASRIGGIPDYVFHGENGLLFPPGDLKQLVQTIRDASVHPMFGKGLVKPETFARTRAYLAPERMGQAFYETYQRLACQKPSTAIC